MPAQADSGHKSAARLNSANSESVATQPSTSQSVARSLGIYFACAIPVCLLGVWAIDVVGMEGIIALGAKHMLETGEWFVPRLYGETYAFKPALAYWLAAISEVIFGQQTAFTLRLPTALCGIGLGAIVFVVMRRLVSPACGLWSGLAVTMSALFIEQVRAATFDVPLALGTGVAMLAACRNFVLGQADWRWWALGYLGLAFGFLAKGIPAIVFYAPGLVVAAFALGRPKDLFRWQHLLGVTVFASIILAYLYRCYQAEGYAAFADHLSELTQRSGRWTWSSLGWTLSTPVLLLVFFLPFSAVLVLAPLHRPRAELSDVARRTQRAARVFLLVDVAALMFAAVDDARYYLPLVTPIAMLCGLAAETLRAVPKAHRCDTGARAYWSWMLSRAELGRRLPVILAVIGIGYSALYAGIVQPRRAAKSSERSIAEALAPHVPQGATVYITERDSHSSLAFYLNRPVRAWNVADPPPAESFFLLLTGRDRPLQYLGSDVVFEPIVSKSSPRNYTYCLGMAKQRKTQSGEISPITPKPN